MSAIDETTQIMPRFDANGLIPVVTQDITTKDVLMVAYMNEEALSKTMETGQAHYWSRSRASLWHKGATSGAIQYVREVRIDCDQDTILLLVETGNGACHTGRKTCFYRKIEQKDAKNILVFLNDGSKN